MDDDDRVQHEQDDRRRLQRDRRALLKGAAVGTAVVWVSPVVLAQTAGALGSLCQQPQTFNWTANQPASGTSALVNFNAGNSTTTGTPVNVRLDLPAGGNLTNRQARYNQVGGTVNNFAMEKNGAATGSTLVLTITFSAPVLGLTFSLLDIDRETGLSNRYTDQITVQALSLANNPILPTSVTLGPTVAGAYPTFTGVASAPDTGTTGNVDLVFPSAGSGIRTLTISYITAQAQICIGDLCFDATSTNQRMGISGFTFC